MSHSTSPPAESRKPRHHMSEADWELLALPGFLTMVVVAILTDSWLWSIAAGYAVPWFIWRTRR